MEDLVIIMQFKRMGYNVDVMWQSACLVIDQIKLNNFAVLFTCSSFSLDSGSVMAAP